MADGPPPSLIKPCRVYSFRDYEVGSFRKAYQSCENDRVCQEDVRKCYQGIESKRLWNALDTLHSLVGHFDRDEIALFKKKYPEVVKLLDEFATIEDLKVFGEE